ncbi:MAG: PBP1A family penicillin-binding protein, partial [Pseudomonadota bacterium]
MLVYHTATKPNPFLRAANKRAPVIQILARDGSLIAERGRPHDYIPLKLLPLHVTGAVMATEDRRFFSHWGIDPNGLARAAFANLRAGRFAQGGSTITQQLAKNLFLTHDRTVQRKANEVVLALWLELMLTKRQILELYLNQVYFGSGAYGIEAAAQRYFGKSARALTVREAAVIAGLLQAPSRYSPFRNAKRAARRGNAVLAKMRAAGIIDKTTLHRARRSKLVFAKPKAAKPGDTGLGYAVDYILERMPSVSGIDDSSGIDNSVIIVETTIDARLQRHAQKVVTDILAKNRRRYPGAQGAAVLLDSEGELRAIVGGRSHSASQFNRATKARRQPGSAFKPFVYLAALDNGMTPETTVYDLPISIGDWSPRNASGAYSGAMTLSQGLARSVNTIAVRLQQQIGDSNVIAAARKLGIDAKLRANPTLALGTSEVTPFELTSAYAVFANGGVRIEPHAIRRIRTHSGRLIYARTTAANQQVISGPRVGQMNAMLAGAVRSGTGKRAAISGHSVAGKTGTTQDGRDAWFVGYTRQLTGGVWIGYDRDGGRSST